MNIREQRLQRARLACVRHRLKLDPVDDVVECAAILGLWRTAEQHRSGAIVKIDRPRIITTGWAAWCRQTSDRQRVIFLFLMPGDVITPAIAGGGNCELLALTRLSSVDAGELQDDAPIARAWIDNADQDYGSRLLDHLAWLNDGSALRNVARLLLELHDRADANGLCRLGRFELPIGQRVIAQALGLSLVQVNKMLQHMRDAALVTYERGWLRIEDAATLRAIAHGATPSGQRRSASVAAAVPMLAD